MDRNPAVRQKSVTLRARWRDPRLLATLISAIGFILSRLVFWRLGIRFDVSTLIGFWQFLDPELLKSELMRSLFYLHTQPPLFNAFLGLLLKGSGGSLTSVGHTCYLIFGLALCLGMVRLMMRLGVSPWLAVGATLFFVSSPAMILYENWLFYTYPLALILVASTLLVSHVVSRRRMIVALGWSVLLAVAVLTRSLFHVSWLVVVVGALWLFVAADRRRMALALLPGLLLTTAVYVKNWVLFDLPATSSWVGMNLAKMSTLPVPEDERQALVDQGAVSPLALISPFSRLDKYPEAYREVWGPDVRALRQQRKSTGRVNYNHVAYLNISRTYLEDGRELVQRFPRRYLTSVGTAWLAFLNSPTEYRFLRRNRHRILGLDRFYSVILYGASPAHWPADAPRLRGGLPARYLVKRCGWLWLLIGTVAVVYGGIQGVRNLCGDEDARGRSVALLFAVITIVWVSVVGNAVEIGENNRFRMMIDPLVFTVAVAAASEGARWVKAQRMRGREA